jgi:hypothetical protein
MAANITSEVTVLQSLTMVSYALNWSGTTPVGTVSVQSSDDYSIDSKGNTANAGTWNTLPLDLAGVSVTAIPISGNTGNGMIDIVGLAHYAIRLIYTFTSGTGNLTAIVAGKVM